MSLVNSPNHYTQGYIEAIYSIEQVLGKEGFKAFCLGNYLKYKIRAEHKGGKEDLDKAEVYLKWAVNGLPAPVKGRVPHDTVSTQPLKHWAQVIAGILQTRLQQTTPDWKVKSVNIDDTNNGNYLLTAEVFHAGVDMIRMCTVRIAEGDRYEEMVDRLIEEFRK